MGRAKAMFIATLWSNGFPTSSCARPARARRAPQAPRPDCTDPALADELAGPAAGGLDDHPAAAAGRHGPTIILQPVDAAGWDAVQAAFTREFPLQTRLFECLAVATPR